MNVTFPVISLGVRQDIVFLDRLLGDISGQHKDYEVKSWFFSAKNNCSSLTARVKEKCSYPELLEIILDQLYTLINFCLQHSLAKNPTNAHITRPHTISLGQCAKLLWDEITRHNNVKKETIKHIDTNQMTAMDQSSQTETKALQTCDSCSSAMLCMKRLLKSFEIPHDKFRLQYEIFDITQFGCMLKVTSSIEEAMQKLYVNLMQARVEHDALKNENQSLKGNIDNRDMKISGLEEEVAVLRCKTEKDSQKLLSLADKNTRLANEMQEKDSKLTMLQETVNNFGICLQSMRKEAKILNNENNRLTKCIVNSVEMLKTCNCLVQNKLKRLDDEYHTIKCIFDQYEKLISYVTLKISKSTKNVGKIELKVASGIELTSQIYEFYTMLKNSEENIKSLLKEKKTRIEYVSTQLSGCNNDVAVKGNPLEDLSKQIEGNSTKIEALQKENEKLQKLLSRFRQIQSDKHV